MKKIEQALPAAIATRKELAEVTRAFTRAAKNIVALEARLVAAHAELDGLVVKAQAALKAANTSGKVLSAKPAKAVPTTKPAAKVVAKPLPKPAAKADAKAAKPAKAGAKLAKAAAKPAAKAAKPAAKVADKPATKKAAKKAAK